jgi:LysM repeat protein
MVPRNRARYLAPIALAATIAVTYLVVHAALNNDHATTQSQVTRHTGTTTTNARRRKPVSHAPTYAVRSGDTLSSISARTGVSLPTLEQLNPNVNPGALQTGQRLRLRR